MLDVKVRTLLAVAAEGSFTRAANTLSLTQPAVSHQIAQLEKELGCTLFRRKDGKLSLTEEGEIALNCAKRMQALEEKMQGEIQDSRRSLRRIRIGVTHTAESNMVSEVLAKCAEKNHNLSITMITDTIKNLYDMLENFELDLAITEEKCTRSDLRAVLLDTDCLLCAVSCNNPLARGNIVTLAELRRERLILRLPTSSTRALLEAGLTGLGESMDDFNVVLEVDNIATIKDLVRKDLGVSILPQSACMQDFRKGKLALLPVENLSMIRQTELVYHKTFSHPEILSEIAATYTDTVRMPGKRT